VLDRAIDNSVCLGLYHGTAQVGFARAVTDRATFAYIDDVFVVPEHRGIGLGRWLVSSLMDGEEVRAVKSWWLLADDAVARRMFEAVGFAEPEPERLLRWMALPNRSRGDWENARDGN
jgi:GNAT superfamily N-acetyltransferase